MPKGTLADLAPRIGKYARALKMTRPKNQLTDAYHIFGEGKCFLGIVKWYTSWRCYSFFPIGDSVYEPTCLRDLATFCEDLTLIRKAERKAKKNAQVS